MVRHNNKNKQNPPRIPLELVLSAENLHHQAKSAVFYAVIIDPETGKATCRIPFYRAMPGEVVSCSIERKSIFDDGRTGPDPDVNGIPTC